MKKSHSKCRLSINCVIVFIGIPILLGFVTLTVIFLGLANEDKFLKSELENPHISSNYQNWTHTTPLELSFVTVPSTWRFQSVDDFYKITDTQNQLIAYCIPSDSTTTRQEIISLLVDFKIINTETDFDIPENTVSNILNIGASYVQKIKAIGHAEIADCYHLHIGDRDAVACDFFFLVGGQFTETEIIQLSQAIMYAYEFHV